MVCCINTNKFPFVFSFFHTCLPLMSLIHLPECAPTKPNVDLSPTWMYPYQTKCGLATYLDVPLPNQMLTCHLPGCAPSKPNVDLSPTGCAPTKPNANLPPPWLCPYQTKCELATSLDVPLPNQMRTCHLPGCAPTKPNADLPLP